MGKKTKEEKSYPLAATITLAIEDHCEDVVGLNGNKSGTLLMKGWHSNYADFKDEKNGILDGCIIVIGDKVFIEVNDRRYFISLQDAILKCADLALNDGRVVDRG